jgi:ribosome biogenesis GTPase
MKTGKVIQSTGANHFIDCNGEVFSCSIKGKLRLKGYRSTNPVAVGDIVDFEWSDEKLGIIVKIHERRNCIMRKSINLSKETHIIASNIDQAVFLFTTRNPETTTVFLDRFLAAAESYSIPTIIIFNKTDIYRPEEFDHIAEIMATYDQIGYKIITASVEKSKNLDLIASVLKDKTSVIAGHSGVGKTSLINALAPGLNLKTSIISESHQSGKHTTTFARMLQLPFGGYIIDTPGIRGFGLVKLKKEEIYHYFPEIFEASHNCRYQNCTHINEPGCAVKADVEEGNIALSRYKSYLNIFFDDDDKHRIKEV